jgi:predicted nucleotidyltransferase
MSDKARLSGYYKDMKREEVLLILSRNQAELHRLGVKRAALFGSVVRGTATEDSDIDILVDIDKTGKVGVFEYVGIVQFIESLFTQTVDVANRESLKAAIRPQIEQEAIYAF